MNIKNSYTAKIPSYAIPYIFNSDDSGLNPEDVINIDNWINRQLRVNNCSRLITIHKKRTPQPGVFFV
jgi:hypothetical protein